MGQLPIWVGGYTPDSAGAGTGEGIYTIVLDTETGALSAGGLTAAVSGPSWLTRYGSTLYAVVEQAEGKVAAFAVHDEGRLSPLGDRTGAGDAPCNLLVHQGHLLSANYTSGSVSVYPITPSGGLAERSDLLVLRGHGIDPVRQAGPHAHAVNVAPCGDGLLITDLGTDRLHRCDLRGGGLVVRDVSIELPAGTGPRHWIGHPRGQLYVTGELNNTITVLRWAGDRTEVLAQLPATASQATGGAPAELLLSPDGRWLYVTVREADCVTVFEILDGGGLRTVAGVPCPAGPRHAVLVAGYLLVAGQDAGQVVAMPVDPVTGVPAPAVSTLAVPSPTCLLPQR